MDDDVWSSLRQDWSSNIRLTMMITTIILFNIQILKQTKYKQIITLLTNNFHKITNPKRTTPNPALKHLQNRARKTEKPSIHIK